MGIGNIANLGMKAAMSDMDTISNNISNANTTGYKKSYSEFADIYATGGNGAGIGVRLSDVKQNFTTGGVQFTDRALDLAINNDGFFVLKSPSDGTVTYTRAGQFDEDKSGYIVAGDFSHLQGYPAANGQIVSSGNLADLQLSTSPIPANGTTKVLANINLDSDATVPSGTFNSADPATYNYRADTTIYDSLGNANTLSVYYVKTAANTWDVQTAINGTPSGVTGTLTFAADGTLIGSSANLATLSWSPTTGATSPQVFGLDMAHSTQYGGFNQVRNVSQDGYQAGTPNGFDIDKDGKITQTYTNGQKMLVGLIALATFPAPQGLSRASNMSWMATGDSGSPILNVSNSIGNIQSGAVEPSNVDLTEEMVKLMDAQHNFQANAQVEQTYNQVMQTIEKI